MSKYTRGLPGNNINYKTGSLVLSNAYQNMSDLEYSNGSSITAQSYIDLDNVRDFQVEAKFTHHPTLGANSKMKWKVLVSMDKVNFFDYNQNGSASPFQSQSAEFLTSIIASGANTVQYGGSIQSNFRAMKIQCIETDTNGTALDQSGNYGTAEISVRVRS